MELIGGQLRCAVLRCPALSWVQPPRPGGENERWKLVKETRTPHLGPNGGGHIEMAQEWQSKEAQVLTHPADDACPVITVDDSELRGKGGKGPQSGDDKGWEG